MTDTGVRKVLQGIGFLDGIGDEHLDGIASIAELVDFKDGQVVFREGDHIDQIYLVASGSISVEVCAPGVGCRRILTVGAGELLGWSLVLEQSRLTATARTLGPTRAVQMSAKQVLTLCEHNPRFGYEFMRRTALALARRLRAARLQLLDVYGAETPEAGQTVA